MKKIIFLITIMCLFCVAQVKAQSDSILVQFELTIPVDFNYDAEIAKMVKLARQDGDLVYVYDLNLTSENFTVNEKLVPGETYLVEIFAIGVRDIEGANCLNRIPRNTILPGLYGLILLYKLNPESFPKDRFVYSFDGGQGNNAPYVNPSKKDNDYSFSIGELQYYLRAYPCVIVFREKKTI